MTCYIQKISILFFTFFLTILSFNVFAADKDVATVIAFKEGAYVLRNGVKINVNLKTQIYLTDKIVTDAKGKMQILFHDDTSLSIGNNSELAVEDFAFGSQSKPKFAVKAVKGVSRVISGKIVEQNPDGFSVNTPSATIGIRGTIVTFAVGEAEDKIYIQQLGKDHSVTVTSAQGEVSTIGAQGTKVLVDTASGQQKVEKITVAENVEINEKIYIEQPIKPVEVSKPTEPKPKKSKPVEVVSVPATPIKKDYRQIYKLVISSHEFMIEKINLINSNFNIFINIDSILERFTD